MIKMKHEIEIPDLPEGWEAVSFRVPEEGEYYFGRHGIDQATDDWPDRPSAIIVRKKQPRRIVLEETDIDAGLDWNDSIHLDDIRIQIDSAKVWKIVEDGK